MTLQQHFNLIKEGKGNKAQFLKQARQLFPQYINQYSDFDTTTKVLKSKQIISEAVGGVVSKGFDIFDWKKILAEEAKAEEKKVTKEVEDYAKSNFDNKDMKNADNINFNEIMKGFYAELRDEKNADKTGDEIKAMVVKNLAKDPLYYTKNGEFGVKDLGYTTEAPGLGEPKEAKGKYKSSGYGDLDTEEKVEKAKANVQDSLGDREAKTSMPSKVKEMSVTPQNSAGVKKMPMPGAEKKIKLKEGIEVGTKLIADFGDGTVTAVNGNEYDVEWSDGTKTTENDSTISDYNVVKESSTTNEFKEGDKVKDSTSGKTGTVLNKTMNPGGMLFYKIKLDGGKEETIRATELEKVTESKLRSIIKQIIREELNEGNLYSGEEWSLEPEGSYWIVTYRTMDGNKEKVFKSEDEARKWIKQNLDK